MVEGDYDIRTRGLPSHFLESEMLFFHSERSLGPKTLVVGGRGPGSPAASPSEIFFPELLLGLQQRGFNYNDPPAGRAPGHVPPLPAD